MHYPWLTEECDFTGALFKQLSHWLVSHVQVDLAVPILEDLIGQDAREEPPGIEQKLLASAKSVACQSLFEKTEVSPRSP